MEIIHDWTSFGGRQLVYKHHASSTRCDMEFALYLPPQAMTAPVPLLVYLSGLTCNWENVVTKAGAQRSCAKHGIAFLAPDTSPRDVSIPGEDETYDFGAGAGFYVDATVAPWEKHYQMRSYILDDVLPLVAENKAIDAEKVAITGHSMGGHGALTLALSTDRFNSVSAFAPIANPMACRWGQRAFSGYLGDDQLHWRAYDACALIEDGASVEHILVDQGLADEFLDEQLKPDALEAACQKADIPLTLRRQPGYDHSYYFIASFVEDHVAYHAERFQ
ncbi:MAG: S-formylglutathione hydrolase [Pseudomonadota bacterium]